MQHETSAPSFKVRLNANRPIGSSFADLYAQVKETFSLYSKIEKVIGPYNSRQASSNIPYVAPSRDYLANTINLRGYKCLNPMTTSSMLGAAIKFCERYKGKKQLVSPHQSTHHAAHFSEGLFKIEEFDMFSWRELCGKDYPVSSVHMITLDNADPIFVENLKMDKFKYLIVRQKLGKTGVPSTTQWEVVLYKTNTGFMIEHTDAEINPRYCGII